MPPAAPVGFAASALSASNERISRCSVSEIRSQAEALKQCSTSDIHTERLDHVLQTALNHMHGEFGELPGCELLAASVQMNIAIKRALERLAIESLSPPPL
jgi:hypothetical protein